MGKIKFVESDEEFDVVCKKLFELMSKNPIPGSKEDEEIRELKRRTDEYIIPHYII